MKNVFQNVTLLLTAINKRVLSEKGISWFWKKDKNAILIKTDHTLFRDFLKMDRKGAPPGKLRPIFKLFSVSKYAKTELKFFVTMPYGMLSKNFQL